MSAWPCRWTSHRFCARDSSRKRCLAEHAKSAEEEMRGIRWYASAGFAIFLVFSALFACSARTLAAPPFYADKTNLLVYQDADGKQHPVTTAADWEKRREHILANMQLVMGPLPDAARKVPLDVQIVEEVRTRHFIRKK